MKEIELIILELEEKMEKAIKNYNINLVKISTGRANPQILNSIKIDYYGDLTPISQITNISVPEPRQLLIKPYERNLIKSIVGVINSASLGFYAVDEGDKARITLPEITFERRKELVKSFSNYTEQAKISIRSARQEANKEIKLLEFSEDEEKKQHDEIQKLTNKYVDKVILRSKEKEKELLEI